MEADETHVGGKPRRANDRNDDKQHKRGHGTDKTPVIGAVERGSKLVAQVANDLTGKGVLNFLKHVVEPNGSVLITDEYKANNTRRQA